MINWDVWSIREEKSDPNLAGLYYFSMIAEKMIRLEKGNERITIKRTIVCGPETDLKKLKKEFDESLSRL